MFWAKKIFCKKQVVNVPECVARLKLGFRDTSVALSWFPCSYRCFALRLVKLSQREKLLPQFVREGGRGMASGGWGMLEYCCMWIQHNSAVCGDICDCVSDEHLSIPILCQEGPYCFQIECHFFCECVWACVCVSHASWHTAWLIVCMPYVLRKVIGSQGHGVAGSALRREETGLISERLAVSCSEGRVHRGYCLRSGYPVSEFTM